MTDPPRSRRAAVGDLVKWSAAIAAASLPLGGCGPGVKPGEVGPATRVAALDQLPPGAAIKTSFEEQPVLVVNDGGTIRAFSGLCTHESCELGWNASQQLIRCPCHGSAFDAKGQVKHGPAPVPLPEFGVRIQKGTVYLLGPRPT